MLSKICTKCLTMKSADQFTRKRSICKACDQERLDRINEISSIAYTLAGGSRHYYRLEKAARLRLRSAARDIYQTRKDSARTYGRVDAKFARQHKGGFIYGIVNVAFPGWVKVGMTTDPLKRLNGYQTGDPYRGYRLIAHRQVADRFAAEAELHAELEPLGARHGEWFEIPEAFVVSRLQ